MRPEQINPALRRRWWWLASLSGLLLLLNLTPWMDQHSEAYLNRALQSAATAYVSARALNAVISVLQETEIELSAAVVGVNLAPGQILDPINDLVERFSGLMLVATSSLAIQKILLLIASSWFFKALFCVVVVALLMALWRYPQVLSEARFKPLRLVLGLLILIRFALPVMALGSDVVDRGFLQQQVQSNISELQQLQQQAELIQQSLESSSVQADDNKSWLEQLGDSFRSLSSPISEWKTRLQNLKPQLEQGVNNLLQLLALFALQTLLLPLLLFWIWRRVLQGLV